MLGKVLSIATALLLLSGGTLPAAESGGTYVFEGPGFTIELNLQRDDAGKLQGSLHDGVSTFELTVDSEGPPIRGKATSPDGTRMGFEAAGFEADGEVQLKLFPFDGAGTPIHELAQTLVLSRLEKSATESGAVVEKAPTREVYVNRVKLDTDFVNAVEARYQTRIEDGRYWYDVACGAWGVEGGPTAGVLMAGLDLPGPMPADISGGGTAIFINGREVHVLDKQALQKVFGQTTPGRYWLDAQGNLGLEGGPALVNLAAAIQRAQQSVTHGYDSTYGARGTLAGGMYSGRTASGKSIFWYPGM